MSLYTSKTNTKMVRVPAAWAYLAKKVLVAIADLALGYLGSPLGRLLDHQINKIESPRRSTTIFVGAIRLYL